MIAQQERRVTNLGELFTDAEIERAGKLYTELKNTGRFCSTVVEKIITPEVLARIDEKIGQKNNAEYLGYMLEYAFMAAGGPR